MIRALNTHEAAVLARRATTRTAMDELRDHGYLAVRRYPDGRIVRDSFGDPVYRPTEKFIPWLDGGTLL